MDKVKFGYCPFEFGVAVQDIQIETLPSLNEAVKQVEQDDFVEKNWIYAPPQKTRQFPSGRVTVSAYRNRVFALPKTHVLLHQHRDNKEHSSFIIWVLSFAIGIRLTDTEAGFLDATPIKTGVLNDMVFNIPESAGSIIEHAGRFWKSHSNTPKVTKAATAVIHSLFLSQYPQALCFERFTNLYIGLDGCHFLNCLMKGRNPRQGTHSERIARLCKDFGIPVPIWANQSASQNVVSDRNEMLHEGLFLDEPLGFAVFGGVSQPNPAKNILLEMQKLVTRLLFAILGFPDVEYPKSSIDDRMQKKVRF